MDRVDNAYHALHMTHQVLDAVDSVGNDSMIESRHRVRFAPVLDSSSSANQPLGALDSVHRRRAAKRRDGLVLVPAVHARPVPDQQGHGVRVAWKGGQVERGAAKVVAERQVDVAVGDKVGDEGRVAVPRGDQEGDVRLDAVAAERVDEAVDQEVGNRLLFFAQRCLD